VGLNGSGLYALLRPARADAPRRRSELPGLGDGRGLLPRALQLWVLAGGGEEGAFYAYAYPEPDGFRMYPVGPAEAYVSDEFGQFLLPYEAVRGASDPDRAVSEFLQASYEAAAERGNWDRKALEDDPHRWRDRR
jgi:hypothetical protein